MAPGEVKPPKKRWTAKDDLRVESEARTLFDGGDAAGAIAYLADHAILFARHEVTSLPCLCAKCLRPELSTVTAEGVPYLRDFVIKRYRALFYWAPAELAGNAGQLRASMRSALRERLRDPAAERVVPTQRLNPFTKQLETVVPRKRALVNPFTGKPVR